MSPYLRKGGSLELVSSDVTLAVTHTSPDRSVQGESALVRSLWTESRKLSVLPESVGSWATMPWISIGRAPWWGLRSAPGGSTATSP